jgi:transcriptional regulator with XRE-family HTH domain
VSNVVFYLTVSRPPTPPDPRIKKPKPPVHDARHGDDGPTSIDGPKIKNVITNVDKTNLDGPRVAAPLDLHDSAAEDFGDVGDDEDTDGGDGQDVDDPTVYRGDKPQKPSSSRRLSPTLMRIFQRKREQIGLSIAQVAKLTGIDIEELTRFEGTNGQHRLVYDYAVLVARVLGIAPKDLPGLRSAKESRDAVGGALGTLSTTLCSGPLLTFEGKSGERFGGDLERVGTTPHFGVKIGDATLGDNWPRGALLGFLMDASPAAGDVVLVRHRKTKQLALRRATAKAWAPLAAWQPSFPVGGDWLPVARLQVVLPRA